jgi:AraC-like DNA-binding protein
MTTRYDERLTLDDIARDSGYAAAHLCEVFRQATGITMHRYLSRLRLLVALEGLEGTESLTRLAYEVGFSTPSHFATAFRLEFGHPPSRLLPALRAEEVARLRSS